jgi:hypothetical protein
MMFVGVQPEAKETPARDMDYYIDRNNFEARMMDIY